MKYLIYAIVVICLAALESSVFAVLGTGSFYPSFLLLAVISVALAFDNYDYVFFGLVGGVLFDILYGLPVGSFTIPLIACGVLVTGVIRKILFTDINWQHFILIVIFATLLIHLWLGFYVNLLSITEWSAITLNWMQLLKKLPWSIAANLIFAYPVFVSVEKLAEWNQRFGRNNIRLK